MTEPAPQSSGDLSPPRAPPVVATSAGSSGRPPRGPTNRRQFRVSKWFVIGALVGTALLISSVVFVVWKRPFPTIPSVLATMILTWLTQRNDPEFTRPFREQTLVWAMIGGAAGELLFTALHGFQREALIWQIVAPIIIGMVWAAAAYLPTFGTLTILRLLSSTSRY
jgi:hypothetical protein